MKLTTKKNSFSSLANARKLLYQIQSKAKRKLDTSDWPDLTAKNFQELWKLTRSLAALCLEEAQKAQDPKQKRMWIAHGVRALRLSGKWLEQTEYEEIKAKLEEVERRQKVIEEKEYEGLPPQARTTS